MKIRISETILAQKFVLGLYHHSDFKEDRDMMSTCQYSCLHKSTNKVKINKHHGKYTIQNIAINSGSNWIIVKYVF